MQIQDKTVVVTGGASGLGQATSRYFAERGARVVIFDLNEESGTAMQAELGPERCLFVAVDVTSEESVRAAVEAAVETFGSVHVCINCAGIPMPCKVLDKEGNPVPLSKFQTVVNVNLIGLFNVMSQCAAVMARNEPENGEERGVVVNISSGAAYEGQIGQCAYSASKAGVVGLNFPAARELGAYGIRVNSIAPGLFHTPMVDSLGKKIVESLVAQVEAPRRMGDMREFAHCCAFIVENAYLNGETVRLDACTRLRAR